MIEAKLFYKPLFGALCTLTSLQVSHAGSDLKTDHYNAPVTLISAAEIALQQISGRIIEAELDNEDGLLVWEFEIVNADQITIEVSIDAVSGAVLEIEEDNS